MKKSTKILALLMILVSSFTVATAVGCGKDDDKKQEIVDDRKIILSETTLDLVRGNTHTLTASLSVGEGEFSWSSSDPSVVTVDEHGILYGVKKGTATITATCEDKTATCTVNVVMPAIDPVFKTPNQTIEIGLTESYPIDGTITYDGLVVTEATVTYQSENPAIATVNETGNVVGVTAGQTTITVRADYYGLIAEMTVPVTVVDNSVLIQPSAAEITLDTINDKEAGFSKAQTLKINVSQNEQDISDDITYTWTAENGEIVELTSSTTNEMVVTAKKKGSTRVTVSFEREGKPYSYTFDVSVALSLYQLDNAVLENYAGDIAVTLSDKDKVEKPNKVLLNGQEIEVLSAVGNQITIAETDLPYGDYEVRVEYDEFGYIVEGATMYAKILEDADKDNFIEIFNGKPNGYFVLSEDIDFGGAQITTLIDSFTGTFDGQGHTLKNFTIKYGAGKNENNVDSYISCVFLKNEGTIKNVGVEYVLGEANDTTSALIHTNVGKVSNVFVEATIAKTGWNTAPLVGTNKGTVENSIVVIHKADNWSGNPARLGALIGTDHNSTITNCYSVHGGLPAADNLPIPYIKDATWNNANIKNYGAYETVTALTKELTALSAADGWSDVWSIHESGVIAFNGKVIGDLILDSTTVELKEGNYAVDLSAIPFDITSIALNGEDVSDKLTGKTLTFAKAELSGGTHTLTITTTDINYTMPVICNAKSIALAAQEVTAADGNVVISLAGVEGTIAKVVIGDKDLTAYLSDAALTVPMAEMPYGKQTVNVVMEGETDYTIELTAYTAKLTQENTPDLATFISTLNAVPNGYFVLTEDLDFGGAISNAVVKGFAGTLDGQGHFVRNFEIKFGANAAVDNYISVLFEINDGIIKNIGFDYIFGTGNSANCGLIETNKGVVENVAVIVEVKANPSNTFGPIVGMNMGVVQNSVIIMSIADGLSVDKLAAVAGYNNGGATAEIRNVYSIASIANSTIYNWGKYNDAKIYGDMSAMTAEVTSFPAENGWSDIWGVSQGVVTFNGKYLANLSLGETTVAIADGNYTVDLSAVTEDITAITLNGEDVSGKLSGKTLTFAKAELSGGTHKLVIATAGVTYEMSVICNAKTEALTKQEIEISNQESVIDLTAVQGNVVKVIIGQTDYVNYLAEGKLIVPTSALAAGEYSLSIVTDGETDYTLEVSITVPTIKLTEENAGTLANFIATLNATPDGNFVLTEDLDFGGAISSTVVKSFTGTLDGQGHFIKNFEIKYGLNTAENDYISVLFENNSGIIKNLGVEYTLGTANNSNVGLVMQNDGTIENLFVNVNFKAYQWTTGAITAINGGTGTVKNSIVVMNTTLTDQAAKNRLGTIVGVDYNGKILNNYAVVNGIHTLEKPYVDTWNNGTYTNNVNYADAAAMLAAVTTLPTENGWNAEVWSISADGVAFGGNTVIAATSTTPDPDPETPALPALPADAIMLTTENAGTPALLKETISKAPDAYYALSADLDLGGGYLVGAIDFTGTLDGRGYSIKNFNINYNAGNDNGYNSYVFKSNSGTIKNIGFVFNFAATNNNYAGLVYANTGTLENIYVDATFASGYTDAGGGTYTNLGILSFQQNAVGTFKNIVINVHSNVESLTAQSFGAISYLNTAGNVVENVHVIHNGVTASNSAPSISPYNWGGIALTGCGTYANVAALNAAVTSLPTESGWSEVWSVKDGAICFNGNAIA